MMLLDLYLIFKKAISMAMIVNGYSMWPLIRSGDRVYFERFSYVYKNPIVGDVVLIKEPSEKNVNAIKRVVAVPKDKVFISEKEIFINGIFLWDHTFIPEDSPPGKSWVLETNEYFLLGDNLNLSIDSRYYGPVVRDAILAKAWLISSKVNGENRLNCEKAID